MSNFPLITNFRCYSYPNLINYCRCLKASFSLVFQFCTVRKISVILFFITTSLLVALNCRLVSSIILVICFRKYNYLFVTSATPCHWNVHLFYSIWNTSCHSQLIYFFSESTHNKSFLFAMSFIDPANIWSCLLAHI